MIDPDARDETFARAVEPDPHVRAPGRRALRLLFRAPGDRWKQASHPARRALLAILAADVVFMAALSASGNVLKYDGARVDPPSGPIALPIEANPRPLPRIRGPLFDKRMSLYARPVPVPLELVIPKIKAVAPVLGVGMNRRNAMDAPQGSPYAPVWQQVFWYRGGAVPGDVGTATIAGHVSGSRGKPSAFARLNDLRAGDTIVIRDTRNGFRVRFIVVETRTYTLDQADDPPVLARIYGAGPVSGMAPQKSSDGLAHLTLVTCAGTFRSSAGTHDRRLAVYAIRVA